MGEESMITKCPCQHCGVNIEFEAEYDGQFVACPSCGNQTRLLLPNSKPASPKLKPGPRQQPNSETKTHLEFIRDNSCYSTLRLVIGIIFVLCIAALGIAVIFELFNHISRMTNADNLIPKTSLNLLVMADILAGVLGSILLVAFWQASLLLVDIADTLLHDHARQKN